MKSLKNFFLLLMAVVIYSCCLSCKDSQDTIIIPFELSDNRIVMNVKINGIEGRYFWDTGATRTATKIPSHSGYHLNSDIIINGSKLKTSSSGTKVNTYMPRAEEINYINSVQNKSLYHTNSI
jgi:hypothetical protein